MGQLHESGNLAGDPTSTAEKVGDGRFPFHARKVPAILSSVAMWQDTKHIIGLLSVPCFTLATGTGWKAAGNRSPVSVRSLS